MDYSTEIEMAYNKVYLINWRYLRVFKSQLLPLLNRDENLKMNKFVREEDQMRFLFGRSGLKLLLSLYTNQSPLVLKIDTNSYGKPYLKDKTCYFNVSHSGQWVAIAISNEPVGVDVEIIEEQEEWRQIAERFFCNDEYDTVNRASNELEQQARFVRVWTHKESYIKAIGLGLSCPLDSFSIDFNTEDLFSGEVFELHGKTRIRSGWSSYAIEVDNQTMGAYSTKNAKIFNQSKVTPQQLSDLIRCSQNI